MTSYRSFRWAALAGRRLSGSPNLGDVKSVVPTPGHRSDMICHLERGPDVDDTAARVFVKRTPHERACLCR